MGRLKGQKIKEPSERKDDVSADRGFVAQMLPLREIIRHKPSFFPLRVTGAHFHLRGEGRGAEDAEKKEGFA